MASKPTGRPKGRPTRISAAIADRIFMLASEGKTDAEIAQTIGINVGTLRNWKGKYPDFFTALKKSKDVADDLVEASLYQRAVGYSHPQTKVFYDTKRGKIVKETVLERLPPDVTACIFWLKNRRPQEWRDAHRHELTGKDGESFTSASRDQVTLLLKSPDLAAATLQIAEALVAGDSAKR